MTIYKFKSFEEAEQVLWVFHPRREYYRRVAGLYEIVFRISPPKCRRGIFKFRSIEDANRSDDINP